MELARYLARGAWLVLVLGVSGCAELANAPPSGALAAKSEPAALEQTAQEQLAAGRWQEAASIYGGLIEARPTDSKVLSGYARAMIGLGQASTAVAPLEKAVAASPQDPRLLNLLGVAYDLCERRGDAAAAYRRGLLAAPGDIMLTTNLGLSQALAGDADAAIATLRPIADGPGSTPRARQNLAVAYALKGDLDNARKLAQLDLDPTAVEGNLAFFGMLRGGGPSSVPSSASQPGADPGAASLHAPPPTVPKATAAKAPTANRPTLDDTLVLAPDSTAAAGDEPSKRSGAASPAGATGPSSAVARGAVGFLKPRETKVASPIEPATPAASPTPAVTGADVALGASVPASWLLELGHFSDRSAAQSAWRELRSAHGDLLGSMAKLAGGNNSDQALLAGPVTSEAEAEADRICGALREQGVRCSKTRI